MSKTNEEIVASLVQEACVSLFRDYALALAVAAPSEFTDEDALLYCGVLGFTGDQCRGTLLLATSREPLGRTNPTSGTSLPSWIAELSNQLLGRVKNQLLKRGITIHLSTPIVLRGQHLAPLPRAEIPPLAFGCDGGDGGVVCAWFDVEFAPGVAVQEEPDSSEAVVSEGQGMLF